VGVVCIEAYRKAGSMTDEALNWGSGLPTQTAVKSGVILGNYRLAFGMLCDVRWHEKNPV